MKQYKYKRKKEEQSYDAPPKHLKLEGAERVRAKKEIKRDQDGWGQEDHEDYCLYIALGKCSCKEVDENDV